MIQRQPVLEFNRVANKSGRPHELRAKPKRSDKSKRRKGYPEKGVAWLRRYVVGILKRPHKGCGPWIELDLNRIANARGYSRSWVQELWARLRKDPAFTAMAKVRLVQKRLNRNACFVTLAALRCRLLYDEEPFFYEDGERVSRHLRETLRDRDLELIQWHCPVSRNTNISGNSTFGQQIEINNGARAEIESSRPGANTAAGQTDANPRAGPEKWVHSPNHLEQSPAENAGGPRKHWIEGQPMTVEGRKRLGKKAVWLALKCSDEHFNWNCQVDFRFDHARVFCWDGLREGLPALLILRAWREAIHAAHADAIDRMARVPCALALFYARRWIGQHTHGSTRERIEKFYEGRKETHNIQKKYYGEPVKKSKPKKSEDEIAMENWARQRRRTKGEKPKLSEIVEEVIEGKHVQN